jgi:hypothetical protein
MNRHLIEPVTHSEALDALTASPAVVDLGWRKCSTLMRAGTLTAADLQEEAEYKLADGSTERYRTFRIGSLKVGDRVFASANGSLLLGQSFLSRLKPWSIDNGRQVLIWE